MIIEMRLQRGLQVKWTDVISFSIEVPFVKITRPDVIQYIAIDTIEAINQRDKEATA